MGLKIGNFFKNIGNAIKAEIKKVAPKVIDTLKKVAGDTFQKGKAIFDKAKTFVQDRIISPLKNGKLMEKLLGGLKSKFEQLSGSVEKGLKEFLSKLQPKTLENGQSVVTPAIQDRNIQEELAKILETIKGQSAGGSSPTTGSTTSAATGTTGSTSSAATTSSSGNRAGGIEQQIMSMGNNMAGLSPLQQNMLDKLKASGASQADIDMQSVTMAMQNLDKMLQFFSNFLASRKNVDQQMIANMK